ncbi:MAG: hypothetical protein LLF80_06120 [Porphyromonadaceae bacterium]|nr:hypothetical protein [Porphyromonadaceae bacterium]
MIEKYIQGYYIPNISRLAEVVIKVLGVSAEVDIRPLRMKTSDAIGSAEKYTNDWGYTVFIDTGILKADELTDPVISLVIHEIWHVKQMEDGRLMNNDVYTVAVWEGVHYTMTMPHDQRPWEIEAEEMAEACFQKVKDHCLNLNILS